MLISVAGRGKTGIQPAAPAAVVAADGIRYQALRKHGLDSVSGGGGHVWPGEVTERKRKACLTVLK